VTDSARLSNSPGTKAIALAGPTATGKSELALLLAETLGGEIISVDSMQVYRGMDIGTAKPSEEQRRRLRHHLIDVANLTETFDAARFVQLARAALADIQARGRVAILCGGTGLYFQALFHGLGEAPPGDPACRAELEAAPLAELLNELENRDPITFEKIDRQNPRRVIRAVEVMRLTGRPFSESRAEWKASPEPGKNKIPLFVLTRDQSDLRSRIDSRVDEMFRRGLVAETSALLERGLARNRTASQALGYKQVIAHLSNGPSLADTIDLVKTRTRQFAKRQLTWFRKYVQGRFIEVGVNANSEDLLRQIEEKLCVE
jgi:tRNA dimethylallyltransferase